MGFTRKIIGQGACAALSLCAAPAMAAPGEPLVVTKMTDPDPDFVPPPADHSAADRSAARADEDAKLEQAMQDVGRVVGQAAMIEQQRPHRACQAAESPGRCSSRRESGTGPRATGRAERRFADKQQPGVSVAIRSLQQC